MEPGRSARPQGPTGRPGSLSHAPSPPPRRGFPAPVHVVLGLALVLSLLVAGRLLFPGPVLHLHASFTATSVPGSSLRPSTLEVTITNDGPRTVAFLPLAQLETDPPTNRAALRFPAVTNDWPLRPGESRTLTFPTAPPPVPWRITLYYRAWRGPLRERLDDAREWARTRGWPLTPPRLYEGASSPWVRPSSPPESP